MRGGMHRILQAQWISPTSARIRGEVPRVSVPAECERSKNSMTHSIDKGTDTTFATLILGSV